MTSVSATQDSTPVKPAVLFVCVKNGGKSQMAAGLMRQVVGDTVVVESAGTQPGDQVNALSAQTLLEAGVDITDQQPHQLTGDMIRGVDRVPIQGAQLGKIIRSRTFLMDIFDANPRPPGQYAPHASGPITTDHCSNRASAESRTHVSLQPRRAWRGIVGTIMRKR